MKLKNETLEHGDRVEVYRNLHNNTFSVRLLRPRLGRGDYSRWKLKGKVIKHHQNWMTLHLQNVKFAVQPAGRDRVRSEGNKNVHAFVRGTVVGAKDYNFIETFKEKCNVWVTYNPYQNDTFVASVPDPETTFTTFQPVLKANLVTLTQGYVYASL